MILKENLKHICCYSERLIQKSRINYYRILFLTWSYIFTVQKLAGNFSSVRICHNSVTGLLSLFILTSVDPAIWIYHSPLSVFITGVKFSDIFTAVRIEQLPIGEES